MRGEEAAPPHLLAEAIDQEHIDDREQADLGGTGVAHKVDAVRLGVADQQWKQHQQPSCGYEEPVPAGDPPPHRAGDKICNSGSTVGERGHDDGGDCGTEEPDQMGGPSLTLAGDRPCCRHRDPPAPRPCERKN